MFAHYHHRAFGRFLEVMTEVAFIDRHLSDSLLQKPYRRDRLLLWFGLFLF